MKNRIEKAIRTLMADPRTARPLSAAGMLQHAARLFGSLTRLRTWCYHKNILASHVLPCTVISIGNITSGGTGKTPMTLHVARLLRRLDYRVVILSRGYRGGAEKRGGIVSDGESLLMAPAAAGDEPFMMARFLEDVPVLVGRDRLKSGRLAVSRFSPDVILLDDGFQHQRLHRDVDIVLLDSTRPFGNTFLLPRGSLREAPDALSRAHVLVFTRWHDDLPAPASRLPAAARSKPVFTSRNLPYIYDIIGSSSVSIDGQKKNDPSRLKGTRVFAFSAIADNRDFHRVLTDMGCQITGSAEFTDHHAYRPDELEAIGKTAKAGGAGLLVTTQKDLSKLPPETSWPLPLVVLGVLPSFAGEGNDFDAFLQSTVEKALAQQNNVQY